jgi:hypothetical protein
MTNPHSREQILGKIELATRTKFFNEHRKNMEFLADDIEVIIERESRLRAKEELEKIHALDTGDSSGALAVANAVADCLSELDKEIKASRLDAETKEQS